ncbi:MAG: hypothetical protein HY859_00955 [Caulobacterales bacterium]|nr:hypothetical protein [Caulobacterales bacterium]
MANLLSCRFTAAALLVALHAVLLGSDSVQTALGSVDDFSGPPTAWIHRSGANVQMLAVTGDDPARPGRRLMELTMQRRDGANTEAGANFFLARRAVAAVPPGSESLRVVLSCDQAQSVYLTVSVLGGVWWKEYASKPLQPAAITPEPVEYLVPLAGLKAGDGTAFTAQEQVIGVTIAGRAPLGVLRVHALEFVRAIDAKGWVSVRAECGNPSALFERGSAPRFVLRPGARPLPGIDALACTVTAYDGTTAAEQVLPLGGATECELRLPELPTGWYELTARPLAGGQAVAQTSCLATTGTVRSGRMPFAVMPATIAENIERIRAVGEDRAFFGIHNLRHQFRLHELMGFPWSIRPSRWIWREPQAVRREAGAPAPWAAKELAAPPMPDHLFAFTSFNPNHFDSLPEWARGRAEDPAPAFRWDDFAAYARDELAVSAHLLPHQRGRITEGTWEVDLNHPSYTTRPIYTDQDIVDYFARFRPLAKAADPAAVVVGPTIIASFFARFEELFRLGLLQQVDALSLHCYAKAEKLCEELPALRRLAARHGRPDVRLYNSESGFTSVVGGVERLKEQACDLVRQNIVLKGEGVTAHLTFYPFDWGRDQEGTYGLCFTLDDRLGFSPGALAPKPAAAALAVCSHQLMGADPVSSLNTWRSQVYGYAFARDGVPVLALWTTAAAGILRLPVGDVAAVTVTGFMGRPAVVPAVDGIAAIPLALEPVYVGGADPALYRAPMTVAATLRPGQEAVLPLPAGTSAVKAWGLEARIDAAGRLALAVPRTCPAGPRALLQSGAGGASQVLWVVVGQAVELVDCRPIQGDGRIDLELTLRNHAIMPVPVSARVSSTGTGSWATRSVEVPAGARATVAVALRSGKAPAPREALAASFELGINGTDVVRGERRLSLLCASRPGAAPPAPPYAGRVRIEGPGSSGTAESADFSFAWDDQGLRLAMVRRDDAECQRWDEGWMWKGDSLQLAFDTDPDQDRPYNPLAGILGKKITEVTVARTRDGARAWRQITHNPAELPIGWCQDWQVTWERDEAAATTRIAIVIPWAGIGIAGPLAPGRQIGFAALVNDLDQEKGERARLRLFGGIDPVKAPAEFGRITLR